jgi:diguanylate cyclase (GGDEF)-like protein
MDNHESRISVLIADDAAVSRTLLRRTLARENFTVLEAATGLEALHLFEQHHPNVVVTDWMMPDLNGIELCRQIQPTKKKVFSYVIVVTSLVQEDKAVEALEAGADDFVTKPFHPNELLARVRVGCRIAELQRELAQKNEWLQHLSLTDPLTKIPNRRAATDWAERELQQAMRHRFPVVLAIADLDRFKLVNDTYGHATGDAVLVQFADILRQNARRGDLAARLGGEEFLLVFSHADLAGAMTALERIRSTMKGHRFHAGGDEFGVTASFGLALYDGRQSADLAGVLAAADQALYAAKAGGRDRVEVALLEGPARETCPQEPDRSCSLAMEEFTCT